MTDFPHFYGLQPRWTGSDRLFKIFVADAALFGARVAGQIYDEHVAQTTLIEPAGLLGFALKPLVEKLLAKRQDAERRYETMDPRSPQFLKMDRANFRLDASSIRSAVLRRKKSRWTASNAGAVTLRLRNGTIKRFILIGNQDLSEVRGLIGQLVADVKMAD